MPEPEDRKQQQQQVIRAVEQTTGRSMSQIARASLQDFQSRFREVTTPRGPSKSTGSALDAPTRPPQPTALPAKPFTTNEPAPGKGKSGDESGNDIPGVIVISNGTAYEAILTGTLGDPIT